MRQHPSIAAVWKDGNGTLSKMENITDDHFEIFYLRISALKAAESMKMDTVFMVEYFWSRLTRFLGSWGI